MPIRTPGAIYPTVPTAMTAYEAERRAEFEARFAALLWRAIARDLKAHEHLCAAK